MKSTSPVNLAFAFGFAVLGAAAPGCGMPHPGAVVTPDKKPADLLMTMWGGDDASDAPDLSMSTCSNLTCQQVDCGELGTKTTLQGTVFAPNGTLPLYNAIVYIPNAPVDKIKNGVSCDRCDGHVSGSPLVKALTGPDGKFSLENAPAGTNIPLVIQIGKWRRQVTIPNVNPCAINKLDANLTRLAKNRTEGDIPQIAIATGSADPMECLLLKIGIDPLAIKNPGQGGRVEMYQAAGNAGSKIDADTPKADDVTRGLYASASQLSFYDIVMLPCEGQEFAQSGVANIVDYVNAGGRVFTTHYSYDWLTYKDSPFNKVADPLVNGMWGKNQSNFPNSLTLQLVTNFPKGMAFAKWLKFAGAISQVNTLNIQDARHDIDTINPMFAQAWATVTVGQYKGTPQLTFNTPIDAPLDDAGVKGYCGRVVYSDFHVAASEINFGQMFPAACKGGAMSDQEKALAFMLFDLSSCVQPDTDIPIT